MSTPAKEVVNPFAAKRQAAASQSEPVTPVTVPPAETTGPKTYQNPFARHDSSPRYVTPRLQPGPLSRWHRTGEPRVPQADPRPVHAILQDSEPATAHLDLSGPLAIEEQRTALFEVPEVETESRTAPTPPDPAQFGARELSQPTWLMPTETNPAIPRDEVVQSFHDERAVAQPPTDPFEVHDVAEVVVSDDAQPLAEPESIKPKPTPPLPPVAALPVQQQPVPPPAPPDADQCYAEAERVASNAASTNEFAAVVRLCQQGLECEPDAKLTSSLRSLAAWACNRSGEIESDRRRDDEALKAFELAIQWDPSCWLAIHNRAVSRAQQGNLEGALADFNRALQLNPGLAVAYRNRGELLAATGRTEEAAADYTTALAQLPQDAELYAMRGEAYHRLGQYDEALADLDQSIQIAPHEAAAYAQRGNVRAELGDYPRAIADFRQAMTVDPQSAEAHRSLAWLLATCPDQRFRNPRQALAAAARAAQLAAPGDPFVLDALAAANANAGQFDQAVRYQQEAIINVPGDFTGPFQDRLALYQQHRPFRNGADALVDQNVRAASLDASPHAPR